MNRRWAKEAFYPSLPTINEKKITMNYLNFLQYADGTNSLEKISNFIKMDLKFVKKFRFIAIYTKII